MTQIAILVAEPTSPQTLSPTRGGRITQIATETLQASIKSLCENMTEVLKDTRQIGGFALKEVQLQVEISAEGNVVLIGKAGVTGGISLTFAPVSGESLPEE